MTGPVLPVVIYDGDCGFCTTATRWGRRWIGQMPAAVPFQRADLARFDLSVEQCESAVQYVARDGKVYAGADAISATLLGAGKGWWFLGALMRAPGIHRLTGVAYRWVARHRHRSCGRMVADVNST